MSESRIRIGPDGSFRLAPEMMERLGWKSGSYLEVSVEGDNVRLRRIEVDPFVEAMKKPDEGAFEKILEQQKKSREEAFRRFEERVKRKDFPEVRPEDKPDHWR